MPIIPNCCSVISTIDISTTQEFSWNVLSYISVTQTFSFTVGEGPLYWFVLESKTSSDCPNLTFESPCCPDSHDYTETLTMMATSIEDLCGRLSQMNYNKTIKSVKKWTKPVLRCDQISTESCNELVDVEFCIPACSEFTDCSSMTFLKTPKNPFMEKNI